jgi:hypothetical protein
VTLIHPHGGGGGDITIINVDCDLAEIPLSETVFHLKNHPNPFNPRTTISYSVSRPQRITIAVYDMCGRRLALLADQVYGAGSHKVEWDGKDLQGRNVSSGTYLVRMEAEETVETRKVMVLR